jgi:hypothetical protein
MILKLVVTVVAGIVFCGLASSESDAAKLRPGWYAYSLLVYADHGYQRNAAGCLRWHWQNREWYDHCGSRRERVIVTRY